MSFTQTHLSYKFKLQQKPDGSWAATADDPPCTLEGSTREEVEEKMRAKIIEQLTPEIADKIKLGTPGVQSNTKLIVKLRPGSPGIANPASAGMFSSGLRSDAAISPKILVLLGATATAFLLLWRIMGRH